MVYKYRIQYAEATNADRYDKNISSASWETIAFGDSHEQIIEQLLRAVNDDAVILDNAWLRLVTDESKVDNY
jgi:hypothetical protein